MTAGSAAADAAPSGPAPRTYWTAVGVLLLAQAVVTGVLASRSFFFADDLLYGSIMSTEPLTLALLTRSWFGHFVPGFIALDWTFVHVFGLSWTAAMVLIVTVQVGGTLAMVRLLTEIRGRAWTNVAAAAITMLSLTVTTQSLWWGAVVTNIVPLAASIATLGCFARWATRHRARHLIGMAIMFGVAVAFYEKSVLTAAYVGLLSLLVLDAGLPWRERWRTTLRRWPAWLLLALIAGIDLVIYASGDFIREAGPAPSVRELATFLLLSFPEGLVPTLFGFQPATMTGAAKVAVLVLTNAVVLGLVVWSSIRSTRARQAWAFFAIGYLLNQGVVGRGRVTQLGVHMGSLLRYQLETVVLLGIALAVALPVVVEGGRRFVPRTPGRRWTAVAAAVAVALGLLLPWSAALRSEVALSGGTATRQYFDNLRSSYAEAQRRSPDLHFVAGQQVPNWVVYWGMTPFNRFDRVLPQVLPDVPFGTDSDRVLAVSESGTVHRAEFVAVADVPVDGRCLTAEGDRSTWTGVLAEPLPEDTWVVRVGHRTERAGTVTVTVDNGAPGADLRMAYDFHSVAPESTELLAVAGSMAVSKVTVQFSGPGRMCLDSLRFGTFEPE